jgi:hypothetical protein
MELTDLGLTKNNSNDAKIPPNLEYKLVQK